MQAPAAFLRAVARSILEIPGVAEGREHFEELPQVAGAAWEAWSKAGTAADRRVDILSLARAPSAAVRVLAKQVADVTAVALPADVRSRLTTALTLLPRRIRRWLRAAEDPRGLSMSAAQAPFSADDILPLIPARLPHFLPGDRPFPGVECQVVELLDVGRFGESWLAHDPNAPAASRFVLKVCLDAATGKRLHGPEAAILFELLRSGRMSGVVALQRTYLDAEPPCLAYEYVGGGDLAGLTYQLHHDKAPADAFHRVVHRLAKTLGAFHRLAPPIVHRNLTASNVLLLPREQGRVSLRVGDFAPGDDLSADPRDDVFALGVLWYQMLLGEMAKPFPPGLAWRPRLLAQGISAPVVELLQACLDDDPGRRPADAAALADRIEELMRLTVAPAAASGSRPVPAPTAAEKPTHAQAHTAVEWFAEGNRCLDRKKYAEAILAFSRALGGGFDEASICRQRAAAHVARRDFARAAADLNRLVALRGNELESHLLRAEFFLTVGKIDEAIADLTVAVKIDPKSARLYVDRGRACLAKGEYDLALACFDKAQRRDPRDTDVFRYRGDAWALKGDGERAFAEYTAALRLRPDDPKLYQMRGEACLRQDRADQAFSDFTEAIRLDGTFAPAYHGRGRVFIALEEWNEARFDLNRVLRLDPRNAAAYRDRAEVRAHLGKHQAALRDYDRALKLAPREPQSYLARGRRHAQFGRHDEAIADFTKAIRLDRKCADAYFGRGRAYLARRELKRAVFDFTKAIALRPESVEARLARGRAYIAAKKYRRARADVKEALLHDPDNKAALELRAEAERAK